MQPSDPEATAYFARARAEHAARLATIATLAAPGRPLLLTHTSPHVASLLLVHRDPSRPAFWRVTYQLGGDIATAREPPP